MSRTDMLKANSDSSCDQSRRITKKCNKNKQVKTSKDKGKKGLLPTPHYLLLTNNNGGWYFNSYRYTIDYCTNSVPGISATHTSLHSNRGLINCCHRERFGYCLWVGMRPTMYNIPMPNVFTATRNCASKSSVFTLPVEIYWIAKSIVVIPCLLKFTKYYYTAYTIEVFNIFLIYFSFYRSPKSSIRFNVPWIMIELSYCIGLGASVYVIVPK